MNLNMRAARARGGNVAGPVLYFPATELPYPATYRAARRTRFRKEPHRSSIAHRDASEQRRRESVGLRFGQMDATMLTQFFPELFARFIGRSGRFIGGSDSEGRNTNAASAFEGRGVAQALITPAFPVSGRTVAGTAGPRRRNHQEETLFAALSLLTHEGVRSCRRQQPVGSS